MQLHLFNPFAAMTDSQPLADWLASQWPIVPPWGDLSSHAIIRIMRMYPGEERFALLLKQGRHRWNLLWYQGRPIGSSAGWKDADGHLWAKEIQ